MEGTQLFFQPPTEKQSLDSPKGNGNQNLGKPLDHWDGKTLGKSLEACLKKSFVIIDFPPTPFISDTSSRKPLSSENEGNCAYLLLHTPGSLGQKGLR